MWEDEDKETLCLQPVWAELGKWETTGLKRSQGQHFCFFLFHGKREGVPGSVLALLLLTCIIILDSSVIPLDLIILHRTPVWGYCVRKTRKTTKTTRKLLKEVDTLQALGGVQWYEERVERGSGLGNTLWIFSGFQNTCTYSLEVAGNIFLGPLPLRNKPQSKQDNLVEKYITSICQASLQMGSYQGAICTSPNQLRPPLCSYQHQPSFPWGKLFPALKSATHGLYLPRMLLPSPLQPGNSYLPSHLNLNATPLGRFSTACPAALHS